MCTPNMHMMCHLQDILLDYDPVHGFWCFSFERYNGMLEAMNKSWINPEKQLLQKFLDLQLVCTLDDTSPNSTSKSFPSLIQAEIATLRSVNKASGSLSQMAYDSIDIIGQIQGLSGSTSHIDPREKPLHTVLRPLFEKCFTDVEMSLLEQVYQALYPHNTTLHLCRVQNSSCQWR